MQIERRHFLRLPVPVLGGVMLGLTDDVRRAAGEKLSFEDFVQRAGTLAKTVIADAERIEDCYLFEVASLAARIDSVPAAKLGEPFKGIIRTGLNYRGSGIVVVQWSMAPGLEYPAHNHPNYNGITLGLEGECRIRNFTPVDALPEPTSTARFALRETQNQLLVPGRVVSVMSTAHDNIHTLRTFSKPVRGIDVMTLVGEHVGFSFVEIDAKSRRDDEVYDATWGERRER